MKVIDELTATRTELEDMKDKISRLINWCYRRQDVLRKRIHDLGFYAKWGDEPKAAESIYISKEAMETIGLYTQEIKDLDWFAWRLYSILGADENE